jgi:hypothetical protein
MRQFSFAIAVVLLSNESLAISKLYDYEAGAVLRDGKPCFYTNRPIVAITPSYLQGQGVEVEVYARNRHDNESLKWGMWLKSRPTIDPVSPKTCMLYGTVSPDKNRKLAVHLDYDDPYYFSLLGEYGRYRVNFCLRKDSQGRDYLSKSEYNDKWICTSESLMEKKTLWQRLFSPD